MEYELFTGRGIRMSKRIRGIGASLFLQLFKGCLYIKLQANTGLQFCFLIIKGRKFVRIYRSG
jgi:hypothetical protein